MNYDRVIRWLHAGLALTVVVQLLSSLLMEPPDPGETVSTLRAGLFEVHEAFGLSAACLLALHWLWGLAGHVYGGWGHLFPWFSAQHRQALLEDLRSIPRWLREGLPDHEDQPIPLAGAVHGLGLLAVSGMALTGGIVFVGMAEDGAMSPAVDLVHQVHMLIAGLVWIFMAGHVGLALLHQWQGHGLITRMFNLKDRS